jgi:hypothetical protein
MMSPEQWLTEYNRVKGDFIKYRSTGTLIPDATLKAVAGDVTKLGESLRNMKKDTKSTLAHSEYSRREVLIENLRNALPLMSSAHMLQSSGAGGEAAKMGLEAGIAGSPSGVQLLPYSATGNPMQSHAGAGAKTGGVDASFASKSAAFSDKGLLQRQAEVIALQDVALKDIEAGVNRLHQQATDIGQEAKLHLAIINSLDQNVDTAADELRAEAKHAEDVRIRSRMCCLYMCVVVEVLVLIILLVVVFQVEGGFKPAGSKAASN